MAKYILTDVSIDFMGKKLFQIKAIQSFGNVSEGELGGYIESEKNLALVSGNAWVYGDAQVYGNARVYGDAQVYGNARVSDNARVSGDAQVYGDAWVYGDARVSDNARVSAKKAFTKGWFIGGDDTEKITKLTKEQIGNEYWKANYVLGDFEISDIEEEKLEGTMVVQDIAEDNTITILGKKYKLTPINDTNTTTE